MVFCSCGHGNVLPWESTTPASAGSPPPEPPLLVAVPVGEEKLPLARVPRQEEVNPQPESGRVPNSCFNHQDRPVQHKCADCHEGFCGDCLVKLQGTLLCGPCKNFRLRKKEEQTTMSGKAVFGVLLAMAFAPGVPAVLCLSPLVPGDVSLVIGGMALLGEIAAILLGILALRETEQNPRLTGRSLAITTLLTGGLASVMTLCLLVAGGR
jgi:hypothetical protein